MYFIILTTALTLHRHGTTNIETTKQAAEALLPLAGKFAYLLFTVGIIGVGFLAIPTLSGSAASMLSRKPSVGNKVWIQSSHPRGLFMQS
jgi:Mn2+/Fe2+ NRAMP family transporter